MEGLSRFSTEKLDTLRHECYTLRSDPEVRDVTELGMNEWLLSSAGRSAEWLSVTQAAAVLDVHHQTIRRYVRGGALPAYRIGPTALGRLRFRREDVEALRTRVGGDDQADGET